MTAVQIHPSAVVSAKARLGAGVKIGPFCIVGDDVALGDDVELLSHVVVEGRTTLGAKTRIFPFSSIGHEPQDRKYEGEPSRLVIGERCVIRENVTINPGTLGGGMETSIGDDCLLMASSHVAHDCQVGNNVILANFVGLAGHCIIEDHVIFGGISGVHQRVRVGAHAIIGAQSLVDSDVIPFGMAVGNRACLAGLNLVGLKRRNFDSDAVQALRAAYNTLFSGEGTLHDRVEATTVKYKDEPLVQQVVSFITASRDRPLCVPRNGNGDE